MLRETATTNRYAVGNIAFMAKRPATAARRWRRNFIREWREFRGLTQEEMAVAIDRTKATVSRIETGDIAYTREFLEAAADVLGTHPGVLLMRAPTAEDGGAAPAARGHK